MNPEQLSDAMNELPQELLEETQAARSRRRPRWKPLAAAAACLLLAAGACSSYPAASSTSLRASPRVTEPDGSKVPSG